MSPRPKKAAARAAFNAARARGLDVKAAAKEAGIAKATAFRWEAESRSNPGTTPSTSSARAEPRAFSSSPDRPGIQPRLPDLEAARKGAGLPPVSETVNGSVPGSAAAPVVTAEQVLDLAEGCVAFGGSVVAGLSGAPAEDVRVASLLKLSPRERGILQPMAPSVARRMPEILEKLDRFMPYAFAGTLLIVTISHCRAIAKVGKEVSAARKAEREAKKAAEERERNKVTVEAPT